MFRIFILIGILSAYFGFSQTTRNNSLLVAEYQKTRPYAVNRTDLVSYNFVNGKLVSKEILLSAPVTKRKHNGSYVHYDGLFVRDNLCRNFIYQNRYVISIIGNVIDIETKSLIMKDSDDFVETIGDSIIFRRENKFTGTEYLICDLKKRTYELVKDSSFYSVKGLQSPNHKFGLEIIKYTLPYKIALWNSQNEMEIVVDDCGSGTTLLPSALRYTVPNVPLHWLDNETFLYASHRQTGVIAGDTISSIEIIKFNILSKVKTRIGQIDSVPPSIGQSIFLAGDHGNPIKFYYARGPVSLNIENSSIYTSHNEINYGNDFSIRHGRNDYHLDSVMYQGQHIGQFYCSSECQSSPGFLAVAHSETALAGPITVSVWNNVTREWADMKIHFTSAVIGWIER